MKSIERKVPLSSVYFNPRFQITGYFDSEFVKEAVDDFSEGEFHPILCEMELWDGKTKDYFTLEDGEKYQACCYDGQHRIAIGKGIGKKSISAVLYTEVDYKELERIVFRLNRVRPGKRRSKAMENEYGIALKQGLPHTMQQALKKAKLRAPNTVYLQQFLFSKYGDDINEWANIMIQYAREMQTEKITASEFKFWFKNRG